MKHKLIIYFLLFCNYSYAQNSGIQLKNNCLVLTIGSNTSHGHPNLITSKKDADSVGKFFIQNGYDVITCNDENYTSTLKKVKQFTNALPQYPIAIIYLAGYLSVSNNKILISINDTKDASIDISDLINKLKKENPNRVYFFIVDACQSGTIESDYQQYEQNAKKILKDFPKNISIFFSSQKFSEKQLENENNNISIITKILLNKMRDSVENASVFIFSKIDLQKLKEVNKLGLDYIDPILKNHNPGVLFFPSHIFKSRNVFDTSKELNPYIDIENEDINRLDTAGKIPIEKIEPSEAYEILINFLENRKLTERELKILDFNKQILDDQDLFEIAYYIINTKQINMSIPWLREAIYKGNDEALILLADIYAINNNVDSAIILLNKAKRNNFDAYGHLAELYDDSIHFSKHYDKTNIKSRQNYEAAYWNNGWISSRGKKRLMEFYLEGKGGRKDIEKYYKVKDNVKK